MDTWLLSARIIVTYLWEERRLSNIIYEKKEVYYWDFVIWQNHFMLFEY